MVEATCREVWDLDICDEESTEDNIAKLVLTIKESKKKIAYMQFEHEVKISELQLKF